LSLLTPDALSQLAAFGLIVQLHRHGHSFPAGDAQAVLRELAGRVP